MSVERTAAAAETEALGARLASELEPGDVVLIAGGLGSGKTTLVRGACRELGVTGPVQSPTFAIGRRYAGRVPVAHLDLFRLGELESEEPGLLDDYLTPDAVAFVEWPGGAAGTIELEPVSGGRVIRVELRHAGGDGREVEISR